MGLFEAAEDPVEWVRTTWAGELIILSPFSSPLSSRVRISSTPPTERFAPAAFGLSRPSAESDDTP